MHGPLLRGSVQRAEGLAERPDPDPACALVKRGLCRQLPEGPAHDPLARASYRPYSAVGCRLA